MCLLGDQYEIAGAENHVAAHALCSVNPTATLQDTRNSRQTRRDLSDPEHGVRAEQGKQLLGVVEDIGSCEVALSDRAFGARSRLTNLTQWHSRIGRKRPDRRHRSRPLARSVSSPDVDRLRRTRPVVCCGGSFTNRQCAGGGARSMREHIRFAQLSQASIHQKHCHAVTSRHFQRDLLCPTMPARRRIRWKPNNWRRGFERSMTSCLRQPLGRFCRFCRNEIATVIACEIDMDVLPSSLLQQRASSTRSDGDVR